MLDTQIYASHFDDAQKAQNRAIEEKESYRWLRTIDDLNGLAEYFPETELIAVGDRESDLFELFDYRRRKASRIHLLVRAEHDRCLEDQPRKLFDHLDALPVMAQAQIEVPRQREKKSKPSQPGRIALPARGAHVDLGWDSVTLSAPATWQTRNLPPIELYALSVVEPHPPQGAKALHWVLLTTVPILPRKQALRCLRWYTLRRRIEEWHRALKSGCRIESHQHRTADRLARAISIDAVIAWRVMLLALLGRQVPEMPCELMFSPWECKLLEKLQPLVAPDTIKGAKKGLCA
ncbi:MAG: IS4 family transposase [Acidobacteria bacterium]|nr:IS4 family transposase [Acidobacteriota bacterium]